MSSKKRKALAGLKMLANTIYGAEPLIMQKEFMPVFYQSSHMERLLGGPDTPA